MALRSLLAVPATSSRFLEKAAQSSADAILIDLEDAVIPSLKLRARPDAIATLNQLDRGHRIVGVRINGLGTPWGYRDVLDVVEACPRPPKCETPAEIHAVNILIDSAEQSAPRSKPVLTMRLIGSPWESPILKPSHKLANGCAHRFSGC